MIFRTSSLLLLAFMATTSFASTTEKQTYVVHMDKTKITALETSLGNSKRWYEAVIDSITEFSAQEEKETSSDPQLLYVYETAISGFAAKLSPKQLESLKNINGFLSATPDEMLTLHTTHSPKFLGLKSGKGLWNAPNSASDVIIGIVDTGIWPEHVSFRDSGMSPVPSRWKGRCEVGTKFVPSNCNKKLIGARAFFKGYESVAGRINETEEYRSARDSNGHGTHTASTAGGDVVPGASCLGRAKGSASGMKYTARIAAYKACWKLGCSSSDILAAVDQAVVDGVDVLSLSLGGTTSRPYHIDNMAIASFGAIQNGVFVSFSAGNSGPSTSTVGNDAPWVMTVAASYLDRSFPTTVKLGDGLIFKGSSLYSGNPTKQLPLVYGETAGGQGAAKYCTDGSLSPSLVKGKIVICDRGINNRAEKGEQVKMAGGSGMLLLNIGSQGEELYADSHVLPATSLGVLAASVIKRYVKSAKTPTASIVFDGTVYNSPAPLIAAFSSRGPSLVGPDVIKPDVTAPGVNILAAWPPSVSPTRLKSDNRSVLFNIVSGTSMSCPHVSGLAALLKAAQKDWSPAAIKSALMTTAYTIDNKRAPIGDASSKLAANPFAFGSGHVDPERASNPGLIYDITNEDYLNYLCSLNYTSSQIARLSRGDFTCPTNDALLLQPGDLNYPSFAVLFNGNAQNITVTYKRMVTNVGTPVSTYAVQVTQPNGVSVMVEPSFLKFNKFGEKLSYKVSFVALGGSTTSSFGSLVWVSRKYTVRSPIAVTWQ
uniref:Putative subtilisin-like protease n=1 Tax=Davidia involucrata TaxID=16924 RepID=A0A5B7BHY6_DAVIN